MLMGFSISLMLILYVDFQTFRGVMKKLSDSPKKLWVLAGLLYLLIVGIWFYFFVAMKARGNSETWKYWDRCKKCKGSFYYKQLSNISALFLMPGIIAGFAVNLNLMYKAENEEFENSEVKGENPKVKGLKRFGITILFSIVLTFFSASVAFMANIFLKFEDADTKQSVLVSVANMLSLPLLMIWVIGLGPIVYQKNGLSRREDFYFEQEEFDDFRTSVVSNEYF